MNKFLFDERPLIVLPSLAKLVGVNGAIVLQQCHWICGIKEEHDDHRTESGGHYWCNYTYAQWRDKVLPWLSLRSTGKVLRELEERGFLFSRKPNKKEWNHTKWYRVNYAAFKVAQNVENSDKEETSESEGRNFLIDKEEVAESIGKKLPNLDKEETSESFYIKKDLKKDLNKKSEKESASLLPEEGSNGLVVDQVPLSVGFGNGSVVDQDLGQKTLPAKTKKGLVKEGKVKKPSSTGSMKQNSKQAKRQQTKKEIVRGFVQGLTNDVDSFLEWRGKKLKEVSGFYADLNVTADVVLNFYAKKLTGYSDEEKAIAAQNLKDTIQADFDAWPGKNRKKNTAESKEDMLYVEFKKFMDEGKEKDAWQFAQESSRGGRNLFNGWIKRYQGWDPRYQ